MSRIWGVTCLFNPTGSAIRVLNFRAFRESFPLPLIAIELSFDGEFSLTERDADRLVRLSKGDVMWQKERLLNQAIRNLPVGVEQVVWADADIVIRDASWVGQVSQALEEFPTVQGFSSVRYLGPDGQPEKIVVSTARAMRESANPADVVDSTLDRDRVVPCSGMVWAARRELLEKHGLYDGCIVGGGDNAWVCGATGLIDQLIRIHRMGDAMAGRYRRWAQPLFADVAGKVGVLPFEIDHLWHGSLANRCGRERHEGLWRVGFDPFRDIALTDDGTWRWNSDRPELHDYVRGYFESRQEGVAAL